MMDSMPTIGDLEDDPSAPSRGDLASSWKGVFRRRGSRLGVGIPLGLAVTGATVAVALSVGSAHTGRSHAPSGRDVLLAAATAVDNLGEAATGNYWRVVEIGRYTLDSRSGGEGPIEVRVRDGIWLAATGGQSVAYRQCLGARPLTAAERAQRAGRPARGWPADSAAARICARGPGPAERSADLTTATDYRLADVPVSSIWLDNLSPEAAVLRRQVEAKLATAHRGGLGVFGHVVLPQLTADLPLRHEIRAAVLRMMADLPGVRAVGKVEDALGRTGQGVAISGLGLDGTELRWIMDPETGGVLGVQEVVTGPGRRPAGAIVAEKAYASAAWTDDTPDADAAAALVARGGD
ncbi:hypothetical protein NE236_34860 [Actinoallomurus purpureus]|uniref:hypothetical protein n=1 Tax=Actinoallomurus purpureus TaxID=478114 RepID=UPI002092439D|nr:hypothetical protein [Actinoallomurus purpureus]MCO6010159.1 hypothetical protein [Actinoallomurus purpureus]